MAKPNLDSSSSIYLDGPLTNTSPTTFANLDNENKEYDLETALPFLIIGSFGVFLNGFTVFILGSSSKLRKKILNTLIIHQSIIDLICSAALIDTAHLSTTDLHGLEGTLADIYCIFLPGKIIYWSPVLVSTFHLVYMNAERYVCIMFPMFHHLHVTRKRVVIGMPFIWAAGIIINALLQTTYSSMMGMCGINLADKDVYNRWYTMLVIHIILEFFLPLVIFIGLNTHIYFNLKKQISKMSEIREKENSLGKSRMDENLGKATRNIFQLMVIMTLCYCICWGFNLTYMALWLAGVVTDITGNGITMMMEL